MTTTRMPRVERRAQLLATARLVFARTGYYQTAMTDIASEAGVTKPVLYQHFESKQDLYAAVLREVADRLSDTVLSAVATSTTTEERVRTGFAAFAEFVVCDPSGATLLLASANPIQDEQGERIGVEAEGSIVETIAALYVTGTELDHVIDFIIAGAIGIGETMARRWLASRRDVDAATLGRLMADQAISGVSLYSRNGAGTDTP